MSTQHQYRTTVEVDGEDLGTFDTVSGIETDSDPQTHFPGGMGEEKSYGSRRKHGAVTVGRVLEFERDWELTRRLLPKIGKAMVTVRRQPLDIDGNPFLSPKTFRGRLKTVSEPDEDSNSDDIGMWELTLTTTVRN